MQCGGWIWVRWFIKQLTKTCISTKRKTCWKHSRCLWVGQKRKNSTFRRPQLGEVCIMTVAKLNWPRNCRSTNMDDDSFVLNGFWRSCQVKRSCYPWLCTRDFISLTSILRFAGHNLKNFALWSWSTAVQNSIDEGTKGKWN